MQTPSPRATVVVPSFDQGKYLPHCLLSLSGQMKDQLETLVYDNLSTDATAAVLHEFGPRLSKVTIEPDRGQAAALNRGFTDARGDILGWLNADDMLMPGALDRAVRALDETGADVVYGHCAHLDAAGAFTGYFPYARAFDRVELQNYNDFIPQPSTFFRRALLDRVGLLNESLHYAMDWDLWCRFATAGARFLFVPEIWAGARVHAAAKTSRGGFRRLREVWKVNARHRTLPLPMVPILYMAYRANRAFALHRLPFVPNWWRSLTGGLRSTVVHGIAPASMIVSDPARLAYPVYGHVLGITLDLDDADYAPASVVANGRPMARRGRTYGATFSGEAVTHSVDILISGINRPLPSPFRVSHSTPAHATG